MELFLKCSATLYEFLVQMNFIQEKKKQKTWLLEIERLNLNFWHLTLTTANHKKIKLTKKFTEQSCKILIISSI